MSDGRQKNGQLEVTKWGCALLMTLMVGTLMAAEKATVNYDPAQDVHWGKKIFMKDKAGVMDSMIIKRRDWERKEEIRENFGLVNTHMFAAPSDEEKRDSVSQQGLKFIEKRVTDGYKESATGSTHSSADKSSGEKVLKNVVSSGGSVKLSDTEFKVRVKPLQGNSTITAIKGTISGNIGINYRGETVVDLSKNINEIEAKAGTKLDVKDRDYTLYVDKKVTDYTIAKLSSTQDQSARAFSHGSDKKIEVIFSQPF